jgi:hypothetical protein
MEKFQLVMIQTFGHIEKRIRFVISTFAMAGLMLLSTFFFFDKVWLFIPVLIIAAYFFTFFSVLEGIEKIEWFTLFLMPVLWTIAAYFFYFLFPGRWITRIPFIVVYGFSMYAILLTSNIFNVGVDRSLQLYRAAFSVNYFYQTLISFLIFNVILSFKLNFAVNALLVFLTIFPITMQLMWSIKLKIHSESYVKQYAFLVSLLISQLATLMSFVPVKSTIFALLLTACYYSISGLLYHFADQKLFKQTVREYVFVAGFVGAIVLLSIQW